MHLSRIALITVDYGNVQEDYHSVAANPSFDGHALLSRLHADGDTNQGYRSAPSFL